MSADRHIRCRGRLSVPLARDAALALFTPEGERAWVTGWDPRYPAGDPLDSTAPGVVFTTAHGGRDTTWVITGRDHDTMSYARVSPGHAAGRITVVCRGVEGTPDRTEVEVTYDLTALTDAAVIELAEFAAGYDDFLAGWERDVRAAGA